MQRLQDALNRGLYQLESPASDMIDALRGAIDHAIAQGCLQADQRDLVVDELLKREQMVSTAIGHGVAVPHAYIEGLTDQVIVFVRLNHALNLGAPDGVPTKFMFVLVGPPGKAVEHLDTLTAVVRLMSDDEFRYDAREARSREEVEQALERFETRSAPLAEREPEAIPEGLRNPGRVAGGMLDDVARRMPHYVSDFTEGLHSKTISSTLFLFFACLAPTVTFGGLMQTATGGQIGMTEMLVATTACGISYALLGGQPLVILGGTGPLLVFTGVLYVLCGKFDIQQHFLATFAWTGLWTGLFMTLIAVTNAACLIRWFTRFTDEIFAMLISTIFISEAVSKTIEYLKNAHSASLSHDVAFLSILLVLGTFATAMLLSRLRSSRYLRPLGREFLADFGPAISLGIMIAFALSFPAVKLDTLTVPDEFATTSGRPWLVDIFSAPVWVRWAAALPAVLGTLLVYMDHNITTRLVNSPDHHLKKGEAYHWDQLLVGIQVAVCSCFGLPWHVAATVRSLNHVRSLATTEQAVLPGGESRSFIIHVRETRVTGLLIHMLIGTSLLLVPLLQKVPQPVLYGLFLYMGVVSITGNQFYERLSLWIMDPALYPRSHYIQNAPLPVIHLYTAIQVVCLGALWLVKISPLGILFPLLISLLVPVRQLASRFFTPEQLRVLDADEMPDEEESEWV